MHAALDRMLEPNASRVPRARGRALPCAMEDESREAASHGAFGHTGRTTPSSLCELERSGTQQGRLVAGMALLASRVAPRATGLTVRVDD
jgi:hypothetical protein